MIFIYFSPSYRLTLASMRNKVVDWHLDFATLFKFGQHIDQQGDVKGIGMIEVIFIDNCLFMLLLIQNLQINHRLS